MYEHTSYYQCGESVLYDNTGRKNKWCDIHLPCADLEGWGRWSAPPPTFENLNFFKLHKVKLPKMARTWNSNVPQSPPPAPKKCLDPRMPAHNLSLIEWTQSYFFLTWVYRWRQRNLAKGCTGLINMPDMQVLFGDRFPIRLIRARSLIKKIISSWRNVPHMYNHIFDTV